MGLCGTVSKFFILVPLKISKLTEFFLFTVRNTNQCANCGLNNDFGKTVFYSPFQLVFRRRDGSLRETDQGMDLNSDPLPVVGS